MSTIRSTYKNPVFRSAAWPAANIINWHFYWLDSTPVVLYFNYIVNDTFNGMDMKLVFCLKRKQFCSKATFHHWNCECNFKRILELILVVLQQWNVSRVIKQSPIWLQHRFCWLVLINAIWFIMDNASGQCTVNAAFNEVILNIQMHLTIDTL